MQFNVDIDKGAKRLYRAYLSTQEEQLGLYDHNINFYTVPPFGKVSLEDAEDMVTERLNLLKVCDEMIRTSENNPNFKRNKVYMDLLESKLENAESKAEKNFYYKLGHSFHSDKDTVNARKRDLTSHFLLRLYYCRNEELKKWFISRECELFRSRLAKCVDNSELPDVLKKNGFAFEEATSEEIADNYNNIHWTNSTKKNSSSTTQVVYKIPFEQSVDAVRNRKVWLNSGFAYIPIHDMLSVICTQFRANLSHSLAVIQKSLHHLEEDERLIPRLHSLHLHHIQVCKSAVNSDDADAEQVTPEMIDTLAKESFSPCMRNIHETLRKEHHLKYYGRLHYGLFLKGIGLTLDDALNFFREEFTKKIAPEKFQKEYGYNIRYNYGKEGRKVIGKAFGCQKIINDNPPGPTDTHGCPFKHFDKNHLNQMLLKHEINEETTKEILSLVEQQDYSRACSRYFNHKHSWYPEVNIYHPNQYYSESRNAFKMSNLTPPASGQQPPTDELNEAAKDTTIQSAAEESLFEMEDEFDKSVASMDLDISGSAETVDASVQ